MTPEHLELYRKLSATKIYKERFGEWHIGDRYWFGYHKKIYFYDERHFMVRKPPESPFMLDVIKLPPVFDPEMPKRCLWGMVDWKSSHSVCPEAVVGIVSLYSGDRWGIYGPLDIALVKTILAQNEITYAEYGNPDYAADPRLVLEGMREAGKLLEFLYYIYKVIDLTNYPEDLETLVDLILDKTGRLANLAKDFLKEQEGK